LATLQSFWNRNRVAVALAVMRAVAPAMAPAMKLHHRLINAGAERAGRAGL
jgi:hypothetical protein